MKIPLFVAQTSFFPIYMQLQVEEALAQTSLDNWCIINEGSPPAVVFGISGKVKDHVQKTSSIPLIRRYSGGGTVVVDQNTLFVSWILQKRHFPSLSTSDSIFSYTESLYREAFSIPSFYLKERDYAIANRKCGGNAQYLRKNQFVHHTTFLWDFSASHMELLSLPKKAPLYRKGRSHVDFLLPLKTYFPSISSLVDCLLTHLETEYAIEKKDLPTDVLTLPHRKRTTVLAKGG